MIPAPCVREPAEFDLAGLEAVAGRAAMTRLRGLARQLHLAFRGEPRGATVWHVNSSGAGGGVADILNSLVPLSTQLGVVTGWLVIGGDERFFQITKAFHNTLQGDRSVVVTDEMVAHYREVTAINARRMEELVAQRGWPPPDVIVLHDPQPAGLIPHWRPRFPRARLVWQGHIDFDAPALDSSASGGMVWRLLRDHINQSDAAIFHLPEQVPPGLTVPARCFLPSINPAGFLNRALTGPAAVRFIDSTLTKYGMDALVDRSQPLVAQIARFDPWKDPLGVIQAYQAASDRLSRKGRRPYLLLAGPVAPDDPEAFGILDQLRETVNGDGLIHVLPLVPNGRRATAEQAQALHELGISQERLRPDELLDLEINALQTRADVIVAKSVREGFGLAVTGAGYHGKPRIVSQIGGLRAQVIDHRGRVNACLVGGTPDFSREASIDMTRDWLVRLLSAPRLRANLGARARRHVIRSFLPHRHLADYLRLFLDLRSPDGRG